MCKVLKIDLVDSYDTNCLNPSKAPITDQQYIKYAA